MATKKCPECGRYSVSFDFYRGVEVCHSRDCNWVNLDHIALPVAHATVITSNRNQTSLAPEEKVRVKTEP